jgi:hypothetical protein
LILNQLYQYQVRCQKLATKYALLKSKTFHFDHLFTLTCSDLICGNFNFLGTKSVYIVINKLVSCMQNPISMAQLSFRSVFWFRVDDHSMIVQFLEKNKKFIGTKKTKWRIKSKWPPSMNFPWFSQFLCKSIETRDLKRIE